MAYREMQSAGAVACYKHASASAAATCGRCLQPICDICIAYAGSVPHCYPCAKITRRNATIRRALALTLVIGAVVGGIAYLATRPPQYYYGVYADKVSLLRQKITSERCDRNATVELEELLLQAGDNRGALADENAFIQKCGDWYRVHWTAYTAHQRLSEHALAAVEAGKLVEHKPEDSDYRWWRGRAEEDSGQIDAAIADYREAIRLQPRITNIPFNLADLLERQGKRCEALSVVQQFLVVYPEEADKLGDRLADLRKGGCPAPAR